MPQLDLGPMASADIIVRPANSIWFCAMMVLLFGESFDRANVGIPVASLLITNMFVQICIIAYLFSIVAAQDCTAEHQLLTYICAYVLSISVLGGDVADAVYTMEFIRLLPTDSKAPVFDTEAQKVVGGGAPRWWKAASFLVCVVLRTALSIAVLQVGIAYIAITESVDDAIKDSVAFLIIVELDDIFFQRALTSFVRSRIEEIPGLRVEAGPELGLFHWLWAALGSWAKAFLIAVWAILSAVGFCSHPAVLVSILALLPIFVLGCRCIGGMAGEGGTAWHGMQWHGRHGLGSIFHHAGATQIGAPAGEAV